MWHCQGVPSVVPSVSEEKEVLHRSLVWAAQSRQKPDLAQRVSFSELGVVGTNEDLTNEGAVTCLGLKFGDLTRAGNPRRSHPDHLLPGVLLEIPGRDLVENGGHDRGDHLPLLLRLLRLFLLLRGGGRHLARSRRCRGSAIFEMVRMAVFLHQEVVQRLIRQRPGPPGLPVAVQCILRSPLRTARSRLAQFWHELLPPLLVELGLRALLRGLHSLNRPQPLPLLKLLLPLPLQLLAHQLLLDPGLGPLLLPLPLELLKLPLALQLLLHPALPLQLPLLHGLELELHLQRPLGLALRLPLPLQLFYLALPALDLLLPSVPLLLSHPAEELVQLLPLGLPGAEPL
mmetsp:Transcript_10232/g.36353  ORF Transcript_10232/g.36353 Transcript_10232/m.36353 type:complete len:344 (+) Transcript_10232:414-1445(+)